MTTLLQVTYLVEDPSPDADAKRQFKYPFAACEIFCCEVEGVYNTLLESDELLDRLFGLLRMPRPLNSMLAGYFARVVGSLLMRRTSDLMQYLQRRQELLPALVHHVDTTSVAEVLARLVGADEPLRAHNSTAAMQWLANANLLQLLVDALGSETPAEGQANAAEVLAAVARSLNSPLTRSMASAEFMGRLVDSALGPHDGAAAPHALNVCIALLEPLPPPDPTLGGSPQPGADVQEQLRAEAIRCVSAAVDRLVSLLDQAGEGELRTSYGVVRPPVGQLRLKAVDLLAALLRTADPQAEIAVMKSGGVQRAMALFLQYPFNNALHGGVTALLTAFEPGSDELRDFLLREARLADWLASAPEQVTPEGNPDDPQSSMRQPLRAGYCGHITMMSNRLHQLRDSCAVIRSHLAENPAWKAYVAERLEPRNKLESVFAWQCGRPATHGGDLVPDAALYSGEMTFPSLDASTFGREVYQRYGVGYDDDDDEEEGTSPDYTFMNLPGAGEPGKLSAPPVSYAAAFGEGSGSDSDNDVPTTWDEGEGADLVIVSSPPEAATSALGPTSVDDMQDDAVVVDDAEAAEGLVSLQAGMGALTVGEGGGSNGTEAATSEGGANGPAKAPNGEDAEAAANNGSSEERGPAGADDFNANTYWKPTFAVAIDEGT